MSRPRRNVARKNQRDGGDHLLWVTEMSTPQAAPPEEVAAGRARLVTEALARAARQIALYGPDHPIAGSALQEARKEVATDQAGGELRVEETGLRWNHEPVPLEGGQVQRLHQSLRDRLVATIKFTPRVEVPDLARLLLLLGEDPQLLLSTGGVMQAFGPTSPDGLIVQDVDFDRDLRECETAWVTACPDLGPETTDPLRGLLTSCLHLVRSVGETQTLEEIRRAMAELAPSDPRDPASATEAVANSIAALIQAAGEIALHTGSTHLQRWQTVILQNLETLGSRWNAFIFRAPVQINQDNPDLLSLLAARMTFGRRIALVLDYPGCIASERSEGLARVLQRLLADSEEAAPLERALHDRALAQGIDEQLYRNVVGSLLPSLTGPRPKGGVLTLGGGRAVQDTALAAESAHLLATLEPRRLRRSRAFMLLDMLDTKAGASHYGMVMKTIVGVLQASAREGDAELVISMLERLLQEEGVRRDDPSRLAVVKNALLGSVDQDMMSLLLRELDGRTPEARSGLLRLLGQLGETGHEALLNWARRIRSQDSGEALEALARTDVPPFAGFRQALLGLPLIELETALRLLLPRLEPPLMARLEIAASLPDPRARLAFLHVADESGSRPLAAVVAALLADPVPDVRATAAGVLGKLGGVGAVPGLCRLLEQESEFRQGARVKEAAARALGDIAVPEAVPALARLLLGGGLLARFASTQARAAAVEALRRIGSPDARHALQNWRRCPQPAVRLLCQKALAELASGPQEAPTGGDDAD